MKLFIWQPNEHGPQSIFVMAETEEQARDAVKSKISDLLAERLFSDYDFYGWDTVNYKLTVASAGEVIFNNND